MSRPNNIAERQLPRLQRAIARTSSGEARQAFMAYCNASANDVKRLREAAEAYFGGDFGRPDDDPA